mgnify:CR=1 FL=1
MADTIDPARADDAPLSTSKHRGAAVEAAGNATLPHPADGNADTLIGRTVTIRRPRAELFAFWRDFTNLSLIHI